MISHARFTIECSKISKRALAILTILLAGLAGLPAAETIVFQDVFEPTSRGELRPNIVGEPPPIGLGYQTAVPNGWTLKNWIIADIESDGPRRAFWVIPQRADARVDAFAEQAGRSRDSIAFAGNPVPADATHYVVEFRQWLNDNDYVGFVLGASEAILQHDGIEFGYERQIPGTDQTV